MKVTGKNVLIMMERYDEAIRASETATNSHGSAVRENDKYLESYEAKINKVRNAWTETTVSMNEAFIGDALVAFTEVGTGSIKILTTIIDKVGLLPAIFGASGIAVGLFRDSFFKLLQQSNTFNKHYDLLRNSLTATNIQMIAGEKSAKTYAGSLALLKTAASGLSVAMKSLVASIAPMLAFAAIGWGISKLTEKFVENRQAAEEMRKELERINTANVDAVTVNKDEVNTLLSDYKKIASDRPSRGFSDIEKEQEYLRISSQLAELFPSLVKEVDSKGNAHLKNAEAIDEEIKKAEELASIERDIRVSEAKDSFKDDKKELDKSQEKIEKLESELKYWQKHGDDGLNRFIDRMIFMNDPGETQRKTQDAIMLLESMIQKEQMMASEIHRKQAENVTSVFDDMTHDLNQRVPQITEIMRELIFSMDMSELNPEEIQNVTTMLSGFAHSLEDMYEAGNQEGFESVVDSIKEFVSEFQTSEVFLDSIPNSIKEIMNIDNTGIDLTKLSYEEFLDAVESGEILSLLASQAHAENEEAMNGAADATGNLADQQEGLVDAYNDSISKIEQLNGFLNELDNEGLTSQSIGVMLEQYPHLLAYMDDEVAMREQIMGIIEEQTELATEMAMESMRQQLYADENIYKSAVDTGNARLKSLAEMYNLDLTKFRTLAEAKLKIESQLLNQLGELWQTYVGNVAKVAGQMGNMIDSTTNGLSKQGQELYQSMAHDPEAQQQMAWALASYQQRMKGMQESLDNIAGISFDMPEIQSTLRNTGRDIDGIGDKAKKAGDKAKKANKDTKDSIKEVAKEYKLSKYVVDEYAKSLEKVNFQIQRQEAITKKFPTYSKQYRDSLRKEIKLLKSKSSVLNQQSKDLQRQIKSGNIKQYGIVDAGSIWDYSVEGTRTSKSGGGGSSSNVASYYLDNFRVSSGFGSRWGTQHKGVDFANGKSGSPVKALSSGKVITASYSKSAGNWVVIQQDDGLVAKYMHMQNGLRVKAGQRVDAGTILGNVGSTGQSTGPHLHFQLEKNGVAFDPLPYLKNMRSKSSSSSTTKTVKYSGKYSREINAAANKYGVDPRLISAIIKHESNFNPKAKSHAGAMGLMQLMPATAKSLGVKNPWDPKQNIMGGTKYIAQQLKAFNGDIRLALAAYNAGPGNVKKYGGIPPFKETQNYVKKVTNTYQKSGGSSNAQLKADASRAEAERQQSIDKARSDLLGMQHEMKEIADKVEELYFSIIESHIEQFDHAKNKLEKNLVKIDYYQSRYDDGSNAWMKQQAKREDVMRKQNKIQRDSIKWIEKEIKTNKNLTKAQKMRLDDILRERQIEMWNMERELLEQRISMAEKIMDTYKRALEAQRDAALKSVDKLLEEIDKKERESEYKKRLEKAQKDRQEILDEISAWAIDGSDEGKKKIKELTEQLQEMEQNIEDMQHDKGIEDRKEALNKKKESINEEYDFLINDERTFANMRSNIIKNNTKDIQKQLETFYKKIGKMTDELGKATVRNLQRSINQMNTYMKNSKTKNVPIPKFHTGGMVKTSSSRGEGMAIVKDKEIVLNNQDSKNILETVKMTRNLFSNLKTPKVPELLSNSQTVQTTIGDITLHVGSLKGDKRDAKNMLDEIADGLLRRGVNFN